MARLWPYLALASRAARANLGRLAFPMKLTFALTYWCNYKCQTCNIWKLKPRDELTLDEIRRFFARSNRFSWVDVTGGEVSLRKDFVDICEALLRNCRSLLMLHYPTNGYLTEQVVSYTREIVRMRPEKLVITVSTDGDEATNDRIRGVSGGYQRQLETVRQLRAVDGVEVVLGMTLSAENVDHFVDAFAAARREIPDLEVRDFHVNIVTEGHCLHNEDLELRKSVESRELARETAVYAKLRGFGLGPFDYLERSFLNRVPRYLETGRTPMRCHALRSSCFVDPCGNVFPCTVYNRKLASLRDVDFDLERIWRSAETAKLQREIWDHQCPQCWTPCEAYQSIMGNFLRPGS
jgi:MoaA/NifB/PqqE/SkfB family radical SAM enzyme